MIMAVGAAPFGKMPSNQEIIRRISALLPEAARNKPDQHLVSEVILKQYTEPWGKKPEFLLASLNVQHPERRLTRGGPDRFGKFPNYVGFASSSAENLWHTTETRLHEPLEALKQDGRLTDPGHEAAVRDAIALHVVRSIPAAASHLASWLKFRQFAKQYWRQRPVDLQRQHVTTYGYWTSDPGRLEHVLEMYLRERDALVTSGALFRVALEDRFKRARTGFQAFDFKILTSRDQEFLIGDVPVLLMRNGRGGLGFFDGVGVGNADEIVMPLTPHHVTVLGQGNESREATPSEVERYNTLQVRIAYHHVYFRIGSDLASFVRSLPPPGQGEPTTSLPTRPHS
jgi:Protein of unknown function (DUF4238)